MSLNFIEEMLRLGGEGSTPPSYLFYRRGFRLGEGTPPSWQDIILSGNTALTLVNAKAANLNYLKLFGGTELLPKTYVDIAILYGGTEFIPQTYLDTVTLDGGTELLPKTYIDNATLYGGTELLPETYLDTVTLDGGTELLPETYLDTVTLDGGTELLPETYLDTVTLSGGCEQRNLPSGYTQVEYLQVAATGAFFLTGINATVDTDMGITASNITASSAQLLVAQCESGGDYFRAAKASASQRIIGNFGPSSVTDNNSDGVAKFTARVNKSGLYVDGSLIGTFSNVPSSFTGIGAVDIFRGKYSNSIYYASEGSRFHRVWVDDNVFLPCRRNSDNKLGIYNIKTGDFILPSGTGSFSAGPDVTTPSPDTPMDIVCNNGVLKFGGNVVDNSIDGQGTFITPSSGTLNRIYKVFGKMPLGDYKLTITGNFEFIVQYKDSMTSPTASGNIGSWATSGEYTFDNPDYFYGIAIRYSNGANISPSNFNGTISLQPLFVRAEGTQEVVTDSVGNTANAEMLLSVSTFKDTQEVLTGAVTRNIGVVVLDGTETWNKSSTYIGSFYTNSMNPDKPKLANNPTVMCSHGFKVNDLSEYAAGQPGACYWYSPQTLNYKYDDGTATVAQFKQWLADQYANGTPVMLVYPTSSATTESVAGQFLSKSPVTQTAGSISGLPIAITESSKTAPTPQQPLDINCNNGVLKVSKNLFNKNTVTLGYYYTDGGVWTSNISSYTSAPIYINADTTVTFSRSSAAGIVYLRIHAFNSNGEWVGLVAKSESTSSLSVTGTTPANTAYIRVCGSKKSNTDEIDNNIQVELGSTATSYMPYGLYVDGTQEVVTDSLGNTASAERLLAAGNYKDTQEVISGTVSRNVGIKVLDGTESGTWSITNNAIGTKSLSVVGMSDALYGVAIKSNYFISSAYTPAQSINNGMFITSNGLFGFSISDIGTTDGQIDAWLAERYASGNPVIVVYPKSSATTESISGQLLQKSPVTQTAGAISGLTITTTESTRTVPTPNAPLSINCNNGVLGIDSQGNITVTGTQEVVTDADGNTASAERLLAAGNYKDTQEVISGSVTRNIGIKVLDGTENWDNIEGYTDLFYLHDNSVITNNAVGNNVPACICSHFKGELTTVSGANQQDCSIKVGYSGVLGAYHFVYIKNSSFNNWTANQLKQWLADQYANGTPVIVIYPKSSPTTETVTGQLLQKSPVTQTAGSMSGLPITITESSHTTPTPTQPLDINCNNGVIKCDTYGLPSGYTKLSYLQGDGAAYLDTGYTMTSDVVEYGITVYGRPPGARSLFGSESNTAPQYSGVPYTGSNNITRAYVGETSNIAETTFPTNQLNTYIIKTTSSTAGEVILNGSSTAFTYSGGIQKQYSIYLFANNQRGTAAQKTATAVYGFYIKDNGILVRNLIPCRRNSDNELGMYDTVSKTFLTNQGTGTFTAGADVLPQVYTDGITETVEITGKNLFDKSIYAGDNSGIIIYTAYRIPNGTYTMSSPDFPYTGNTTNVFFFAGNVSSGASSVDNGVAINKPITVTVTDGYYTVGHRYSASANPSHPINYNWQIEQGSTATTYEVYYNGGTATAEMLLAVSTYQDIQSVIDGEVTRNVGVKVLDGTQSWSTDTYGGYRRFYLTNVSVVSENSNNVYCTHYNSNLEGGTGIKQNNCYISPTGTLVIYISANQTFATVTEFNAWLANQYSAGTPVIIVYPSSSPTTETVAPQELTVQEGTNQLVITQASMDNLETSFSYSVHTQPSAQQPLQINCNNGVLGVDSQGNITVTGTTEQVTDNVGNTANAQRLLKVSTYKDTQEVISGNVTRNIGIKVLNGTENWQQSSNLTKFYLALSDCVVVADDTHVPSVCSHFIDQGVAPSSMTSGYTVWTTGTTSYMQILVSNFRFTTVSELKTWLSDQYTAGTPIILIYPLNTATTESVSGQGLQKSPVTQTAGSMSDLGVTITESSHTTPSSSQPLQIKCNNGVLSADNQGNITVTGTVETVEVNTTGDTATAQNLFAVDTYKDEQHVITGEVIRRCGVVYYDGTQTISTPYISTTGGLNVGSIIVYQLSTSTTEIVTPQDLTVQEGENQLVITQASMNNLTTDFVYSVHTTPTPQQPLQINCNNGVLSVDSLGNITITGTTEKVEVNTTGDFAIAQDLLAVGNYMDEQNVTTGEVIRRVGIKVFDGTEAWTYQAVTEGSLFSTVISTSREVDMGPFNVLSGVSNWIPFRTTNGDFDIITEGIENSQCFCNKYRSVLKANRTNNTMSGDGNVYDFIDNRFTSVSAWTTWLADQYSAGTPVIVIFPLETETTESVTSQALAVRAGTNIVEITEASMSGLPLEVSYIGRA